jgi:hypothetical protein
MLAGMAAYQVLRHRWKPRAIAWTLAGTSAVGAFSVLLFIDTMSGQQALYLPLGSARRSFGICLGQHSSDN